ncbi:hypothetical protein PVL29_025411 [Vitis rotundifolia]|uniref:Uncharacterized protein n=1 Tax=Vitis rotundifolia TaxID=103349 RepID=A0AA38YJQ6_VITRO|nr:hypothetical protein PVL29_025411 [Vitis rotundifolia]
MVAFCSWTLFNTWAVREGIWVWLLTPKIENQDAIDAAIVGVPAGQKEVQVEIREVRFLPFNPVAKRIAPTYIDADEKRHRASKGTTEQILNFCNCKGDARRKGAWSDR